MAITSGAISRSNIIELGYEEIDIGGTSLAAASGDDGWRRLGSGQSFMAYVHVNTFDAADTLDTLRLEEAKDGNGLDSATITGKALAVLAADVVPGAVFLLEAKVGDLQDDFGFIRLAASESSDTGPNEITVIYVRSKGGDLTEADARV